MEPLNSLIVFSHPNPKSFTAAICETAADELRHLGEVRVHDLYAMNFNPILMSDDFTERASGRVPQDVLPLQNDVAWADLLLLVFPTWWAGPPAMLHGYFDRVFANGFAFRYTEKGPEGLLKGKRAIVFQTTGTPGEIYQEQTRAMNTVLDFNTLQFCGIDVRAHEYFYGVPYVSDTDRQKMLGRARETVTRVVGAPLNV
jgi:NAD(P)H dehydrogenase (quinone)